MTDAVLILCTVGTLPEAERIAQALVEERLAACVQWSPISSVYRWEGVVERATEQRLHIKTSAARATAVEARIRALHSYAVPEIVTLAIAHGSPDYLAWIEAAVTA